MYDVTGIGARIAFLRRQQGLTQEALAERLGLSAQAVSKWETGIGYPDLVLLPRLASELGTTIDGLFGHQPADEAAGPKSEIDFPDSYNGLKRVATFASCALFSDLEPVSQEGPRVHFADGSEADLSSHTAINRGRHRILILCEGEWDEEEEESGPDFTTAPLAADIRRLQLKLSGLARVLVLPAPAGEKSSWQASGTPAFMKGLTVEQQGERLYVRLHYRNRGFAIFRTLGRDSDGELKIYLTEEQLTELEADVQGGVTFRSDLDCQKTSFDLSGGGSINFADAGHLTVTINGAGQLTCQAARDADVEINGAGQARIRRLTGRARCKLSGAGQMKLAGAVERLDLAMGGAGQVNAKELVVDELKVHLSGASHASIGRVRGQSTERVSQASRLKILERG